MRKGHEGHHEHMSYGSIDCSCGEPIGVICFTLDPRYFDSDLKVIEQAAREDADFNAWVTCSVCGKTGVQFSGDYGKPFGPSESQARRVAEQNRK